MRLLFALALLFIILSCRNTKSKEQTFVKTENKNPWVQPDTFNLRDIDIEPSLQKDIFLDTIDIPESKKHLGVSIIYPKLSPNKFPYVYKWVKELVKEKEKAFYENINGDAVQGYYMWMEPQLLCQTKKALSLVIQHGSGFRANSAWFEYCVMNFDLERKKEIFLTDYFILNTPADSAFFQKILRRCTDNEMSNNYLGPIEDFNFSFDDSTIYFCFDKYHLAGAGIFSVEKKYILDHINPIYHSDR